MVAIVPHQRIGVEQDRKHACRKSQLQTQILQESRSQQFPAPEKTSCRHQFRADPSRGNRDAAPAVRPHPSLRNVHVKGGMQAEHLHPNLGNPPPERLADQCMPGLMHHLQPKQTRIKSQQILPAPKPLGMQLHPANIPQCHQQTGQHPDPQHGSERTAHSLACQPRIRIPQPHPPK